LFIIKFPTGIDPSCLVVIDLKHNMLYPFTSKGAFKTLLDRDPERRLEYVFHYFKLSNKAIFLSIDLIYIFTIRLQELNKKLYAIGHSECKAEYYEYLEDFVEVFDLKQLISNAILSTYKTQIEGDKIKALSYYIDKDLDKLYIIAKYDIDNKMHIGIFEFIPSVKGALLRLMTYYPYEYLLYYKNKYHISLSDLFVHRIYHTDTFNSSLEMVCNLSPKLIDVENNRAGIRMISKDFSTERVTCKNLDGVLVVELRYKRLSGLRVPIVKYELFVISRLSLVSKMPILSL